MKDFRKAQREHEKYDGIVMRMVDLIDPSIEVDERIIAEYMLEGIMPHLCAEAIIENSKRNK